MELRHLRYFVLVAEELHFTRAAERAGIAQPPLSQQIRTLEGELGVPLFTRSRRHVALTDAGRALLPRARQVLREADRARDAALAGAAGATGIVRAGFTGSLAFGLLPALISRSRVVYPELRLDVQELTSEQQRSRLREQALDLGLPTDQRGRVVELLG